MKKLTLTILFVISAMTATLASEGNIDARVDKAFKDKFGSATNVTWKKSESNYLVTFTINNSVLTATYSATGKLMEVKRNISPMGLTGQLQKCLKTYYDGRWVTDLVEITKNDVKAYYVTLEGPDNKIMMESIAGSNWEMISVLNKDGGSIINK